MSLVSRESCFRKQCTVVPTQSDSDVAFCLQLLSKILKCILPQNATVTVNALSESRVIT